jgi:hypothetical protein
MKHFITLTPQYLRLNDLAGLVSETITVALPCSEALGAVGAADLQALDARNRAFLMRLSLNRASLLTPQIAEKDRACGALFAEVARTSSAAARSSLPATAEAGAVLALLLHPFRGACRRPIMTQMTQIRNLATDYAADPHAAAAATALGLASRFEALFTENAALHTLYEARRAELAEVEDGPSASALKDGVVAAYNNFCATLDLTLEALPSETLRVLCTEMNDIRRKYVARRAISLTDASISTEPVPELPATGKPLTPIPRVFRRTATGLVELVFAVDFDVTYHNNINPGTARLLIHGKGKYTGTYVATFNIKKK